jgi:hypothetical protein
VAAKKKAAAPKAPAAAKCPMPYTGNSDANPKGKATEQAIKFAQIMHDRWGFTNLGIYAYRPMRGSGNLSVHATGRAVDLGYKPSFQPRVSEICDWLADNYLTLGIEEVHQYSWEGSDWGRGFRCCRDGKPGWKTWTAEANGGTPGGKWIHVELAPTQTATGLVRAWKAIEPKPAK